MTLRQALLAAAFLAGAAYLTRPAPSPEPATPRLEPSAERQAARQLRAPDLAGRMVSLSDFKGRPVLLSFWATWCETCVAEMPVLEALHRRHRAQGLVVLAASIDEGGRKAVMPFVAQHNMTFPVLLAGERGGRDWVRGLPSLYLIDRDGRVAKKRFGPVPSLTLESDVAALLNL